MAKTKILWKITYMRVSEAKVDFNIDIGISNTDHDKLEQFCSLFNLKSLIKVAETCIAKTHKSNIELILTNKSFSFQNSSAIERDHHRLIPTFVKSHFTRHDPKTYY